MPLIREVIISRLTICISFMYWDADEVGDFVRYPIEGRAGELGSPIHGVAQADLENEELMSEIREEYQEKGFDSLPILPWSTTREYYDTQTGEVRQIEEEQYVSFKDDILHCFNVLTEYPFVMITHPDWKSWGIVTRADLNTRTAKEYLYSYYAETARAVSRLIESEYDVDELQELYLDVREGGNALDYWRRALDENVDLHPVEFLSMAEMKEIVAATESLRERLQFPSKTQTRNAFKLVEKYRNRVMHGYRTIILDQEGVIELVESLEIASEMTIHAGGDEPGHVLPP